MMEEQISAVNTEERGGIKHDHHPFLKWFVLVSIIVAVVFAAVPLFDIYNAKNSSTEYMILGGDRDAHGCIPSVGYSWCEVKQKCLRIWEEPCEETSAAPAE